MRSGQADATRLAVAIAAIAAITVVLGPGLHVSNAAIVSTTYLMVVLLVAATSRLRVAVVTSVVSMLCLNFFFLPPVGTFTIADPQNWVALVAFIAVSLVASHLSAVAQARTEEAIDRRDELARLFDLGRDVLMVTDGRDALGILARSIARRFDLAFVAVALPRDHTWDIHDAGSAPIQLERRDLSNALASAQASLEFDASTRTYAGHRIVTVDGREVRLVPLRAGTRPIGVLAAAGRPVEPGTLDTLAGLVALAVERAHFLEAMKASELTRQSEVLKTALLASIGHDLRTPLTAIAVAAGNLKTPDLTAEDRVEQSELILAQTARLTGLFQNILDMARIDAGAVTADAHWTHPSEIVAVARGQVEHALHGRQLEVSIDRDVPVQIDPRLSARALAHLLENAGHYSPSGTVIRVVIETTGEGLVVRVRDHGPGIAPVDLPHLFERFYRGSAAGSHLSGTGMGLWIVRGLLAAVGGRVWADNHPDGGALFTMVVPAAVRETEPAESPAS